MIGEAFDGRPDADAPLPVDDDLVARCLDGRASADDIRAVQARLAADPAFRKYWLEVATVDALLAQRGEERGLAQPLAAGSSPFEQAPELARAAANRGSPPAAGSRPPSRWLPVAAGLAGVTIGCFFATAVWAMVVPLRPAVVRILIESFETGEPPAVTGAPLQTGSWGGDFTELVGPQRGVSPAAGSHMLRFVRADYEGKPSEGGAYCSVLRIVDLRPFRQRLSGGNCAVQISALFNTSADAGDHQDQCGVAAAAVDAATAFDGSLRKSGELQKRAAAYAVCRRVDLDRDVGTWQPAVVEMRLPADADFLVMEVRVNEFPPILGGPLALFSGHYCDDIRVSLVERQPVR